MCERHKRVGFYFRSNFSLLCTVLLLSLGTQSGDRHSSSRTEELRGKVASEEALPFLTSPLGLIDALQTFRVQQKFIMSVI